MTEQRSVSVGAGPAAEAACGTGQACSGLSAWVRWQ